MDMSFSTWSRDESGCAHTPPPATYTDGWHVQPSFSSSSFFFENGGARARDGEKGEILLFGEEGKRVGGLLRKKTSLMHLLAALRCV